ncbi:BCLAF1 and THRAP3 family member 3 isoform X2 [Rhinatrema bivittatum]|uniref:BCLAF1 and THRAP3 family member 3 isoform X2 n=1 Tax=Rhinatrema bivittatum TaxID=194408 RepID=UPI00112CD8B7|nr:BCLAF1 and THRAP3 family member 3 isoform X2 [Rhinatrema bivittatum]
MGWMKGSFGSSLSGLGVPPGDVTSGFRPQPESLLHQAKSRTKKSFSSARSSSPTYRSPERHRQRYFHNHDGEFKGFMNDFRRPMHWREENGKYGQSNSRPVPRGNMHPRIYDYSLPSPRLRTPPLEDPHRNKVQRNYHPERSQINPRYPYPPIYPDVAVYQEHERHFYQDKVHGRHMHEEPRGPRGEKRVKPFHGPDAASSKHEGKWPEDDVRHQRIQLDKYSYSPRRSSEEFVGRSSYQKRYPEERDFRDYGPAPKRARGDTERHENREPVRNSQWKPDHPLPPQQDKETPRDTASRAFHSSEQDYLKDSSVSKVAFDYSHKFHRYAGDDTLVTDGRAPRHTRQEERKFSPAKGPVRSKELDGFGGHRVQAPEEGQKQVPLKYSSEKYHSVCPADACKGDTDLRPLSNKLKERVRKEGDSKKTPRSSSNQLDKSHKPAYVKVSSSNVSRKTESFMVKVDMKKMVDKYRTASSPTAERQMSNDLVAVSRKKVDFHPVFEHIETAPLDLQNNSKREFTHEIITIIHEVKANYFKPSALTLHERFSKMQHEKEANGNKAVENSNPEIHRRIDISLADLKNKRAKRSESGQTGAKVIDDPHDLRHDIERRRKERLRSEDERVFDTGIPDSILHLPILVPKCITLCLSILEEAGEEWDTSSKLTSCMVSMLTRDNLSSSLSSLQRPKTKEFEKSSRVMRAPFRKFDGRPHSEHGNTGSEI